MFNHYEKSWQLYKAHTEAENFRDDFDYYLDFCKGNKALDLFAGYGRLTNFLVKNDIDIEAVELEDNFAKFINLPPSKKHVCNVLHFKPQYQFDRIIAGYNSFSLLTRDKDIVSFFKQLDILLKPEGVVSLSYYHHDFWKDVVGYTFLYENEEIHYTPGFDLSRSKEKIGIWIDQYKGKNINTHFKYKIKIYDDANSLSAFLAGTDLAVVNEVKSFNNKNCIEPGWINYTIKKKMASSQ